LQDVGVQSSERWRFEEVGNCLKLLNRWLV